MLSSNTAIQSQRDTIWDGVGMGALAGGAAGAGLAYYNAPVKRVETRAATADTTKSVFDQKGYDGAVSKHNQRISDTRSMGLELIEKSENHWNAANSIQFEDGQYRGSLTEKQKTTMQENVHHAERYADQSLKAMEKLEKLEGTNINQADYYKNQVVKGNAAHYENKRKMSSKRGLIGTGVGMAVGGLAGGMMDYSSK